MTMCLKAPMSTSNQKVRFFFSSCVRILHETSFFQVYCTDSCYRGALGSDAALGGGWEVRGGTLELE